MGTLYGLAAFVIAVGVAQVVPDASERRPRVDVPELVIESSAGNAGAAARLRQFDTTELGTAMRLVGLESSGGAIRVILAGERSGLARRTPHWIAGFAHADDTIVLFPERSPQYPHDSLEQVLHHEVAHVLISRAAAGGRIPRWFSEGLATLAERGWGREDRRHLARALMIRGPLSMEDVESWFAGGHADASRAYAVATAFVRDLLEVHGEGTARRILASIAAGRSFEAAFVEATGETLAARERAFDARMAPWERWAPLLTDPHVLWIAVTALALLAIWRGRRRRAERRRRWDNEQMDDRDAVWEGDEPHRRAGGHAGIRSDDGSA